MSRSLLCQNCAARKEEGERQLYAASSLGEPAEYERVVWGKALPPHPNQRVMFINERPHLLPLSHYDCDQCAAPISLGERCCAWTIWTDATGPIGSWERAFINPEDATKG